MAPSFASLLAIFVPAFVVQADDFLPAASPLVLWAGRSAPGSVPGSVSFDWEGTSATFSVAGVGASVTLHTNVTLPVGKAARVSVFVNDIDTANLMLDSATSSYLLATALEKPVNRVMVQYTLEPGASGASRGSMELPTFEGFSVGNKGSFVKSTPLLRRIDIIGDSITAGSDYDKLQAVKGQLSLETECDPWAPITGYSQAYAWESYLCRYFQANCTTVAWSGKGLIHNSGCSPGPTMPTLYNQTFATSATELWDFSKSSRPDAVIIHLGTNDYSCGQTTDAAFTAAYIALMQSIEHKYAASPGSSKPIHFFCVIGAMSATKPLAAITATLHQAAAAGLSASLLDMRNNTLDGCGGHPGPIGHWEMAVQAAPQIQRQMGWKSDDDTFVGVR